MPQPIDFRKVVRVSLGSPDASDFTARQMCGRNFFPVVIMQTAFWKSTRSIKPYASEVKREICLECTGECIPLRNELKWLFYFAPHSVFPAVNMRSVKYAIANDFLETNYSNWAFMWIKPDKDKYVSVIRPHMLDGLTVFGNRALKLTLWKKSTSTYTFSESLIVIGYNYIFEIC